MPFGGRREPGERTAEDRARAAAERAARRAEPPPPQEVFEHEVPPDDVAQDGRSHRPAADEASNYDPGPAYDPPVDDAEPETAPRAVTAVEDRPPPPRRVPATRRRPPRRPPPAPRRPRAGSWRRRLGAVLALGAIAVALYAINATFQPFHEDGSGSVVVKVPEGADAGRIGDILAEAGVVDSGTFFQLNATLTGRRGSLRSGEYTLRSGMSNGDAIEALTKGPKVRVVPTVEVTVPEGPSIRETAPIVDKGPLEGSYLKAATADRVVRRVRRLGAPRRTRTAEGFLFPATYTLVDGSPARNLVAKQLDAFEENFGSVDMAYAKRRNLSRYDVLTIASLVEREAQIARERPLIASVIYNRLRLGMPLGIDATIRYDTDNWTRPIRMSELEADTPYNTRLREGLPPTPIGNPGLASIKAAARPERTDYLFFVRKPGDSGEHAFSSTDAEFQRDYDRYHDSRGGP
jgi:peptidoglycan lytic transglycosylase G